jgi:hypothetical protein
MPRVTILCHSKEKLGFYIYIWLGFLEIIGLRLSAYLKATYGFILEEYVLKNKISRERFLFFQLLGILLNQLIVDAFISGILSEWTGLKNGCVSGIFAQINGFKIFSLSFTNF